MQIEKDILKDNDVNRHEACQNKLKFKFEQDEYFRDQFVHTYNFFRDMFFKIIKDRPSREDFENRLYPYVSDLIYQGYYIACEIIEDENTLIPNEFLQNPNGILKENIYALLDEATGDIIQTISHSDGASFETWVLDQYNNTEKLLYQTKIDFALLGSLHAFIDQREQRNLFVKEEIPGIASGIIHRSDDLYFLDPQVYICCILTNGHSEIWEVNYSSSVQSRVKRIGELHIHQFKKNEIIQNISSLPVYVNSKDYNQETQIKASLALSNVIKKEERSYITEKLFSIIKDRTGIDTTCIQLLVNTSEEFYIYTEKP